MNNSKNIYIFSIITSVIVTLLGIFMGPHSRSVYDAASIRLDNDFSKISSLEDSVSSLADTFSTANVVDNTIRFTAPIYDTYNMEYKDLAKNNHFYDNYSIMHYIESGSDFYYAHDTGAFANVSALDYGTIFYLGGDAYVVTNIAYYTIAEAAPIMNKITHAGYVHDISLMTCSGVYDNATGTKPYRLVVYADRA